jgi:hypothetical protein
MRRAKKEINKGMVAFKCILMTFVWTTVIYWITYWVVVLIKYLAWHYTFDQLMPTIWLILMFAFCGSAQYDNYDHIVHPEKYEDNTDED